MVLFFRKPRWFQEILAMYGGYSFAVLMIVGGLLLFGREFWVMLNKKKCSGNDTRRERDEP